VYDTAPSDAFVSKITFEEGAEAISLLIKLKHKGIINVGQKKISLYELYRKYKPEIKAVSIKDIPQEKQRAKDSSLNIELWEKTKGKS
jgi:dTDP-4-dehydrorhamnose reductase